jgi:hypothetical protein
MSTVRLSFLANCRSMNIPWRSSTRFFALSLKSLCDADLQLLFEPFPITETPNLVLHNDPATRKNKQPQYQIFYFFYFIFFKKKKRQKDNNNNEILHQETNQIAPNLPVNLS